MNGYHEQYQVVEPKYIYFKNALGKDGEIDYGKLHGKVLVVKYLNRIIESRENYYCSNINDDKDRKMIDLTRGNFKIFVTEKLVDSANGGIWVQKCSAILLPKVFACNLSYLSLQDQNITYNDYLMLVSSGRLAEIYFITTQVTDKNDQMVPLEKLCEHLLNVEKLYMMYTTDEGSLESVRYKFNTTDETAQALLDLLCFKRLKEVNLDTVPLEKSFKTFAKFMKKHAFAKFDIKLLCFRQKHRVTDKEKAALNQIRKELIETWPTNDKPEIWI